MQLALGLKKMPHELQLKFNNDKNNTPMNFSK